MSTYSINYALWTGVTGAVLEYAKRKGGVRWQTLLYKGVFEKAIVSLIASYLQAQNVALLGNNLDANYIYNGVLASLMTMYTKDKSAIHGAEEQIACALIGHRLASNFGTAFDSVATKIPFISNMFAGAGGYVNASIPDPGTPMPSAASGNTNPV